MFYSIRNFFKTTILGGLFVLLPIILFIYLVSWFIGGFISIFDPLSQLYSKSIGVHIYIGHLVSFFTLVAICFCIGVFTRTQLGNLFHFYVNHLLNKIPGYSIINDIFTQFFGKDKKSFSKAVLVDRLGNGIFESGFITDEYNIDSILYNSIFIPTGPNPTSGFIIQVPNSKIIKETTAIDKTMKSIISCGAGSSKIWGDQK